MKNILLLTAVLFSSLVFGQKITHVDAKTFANEIKENPGTILDVRTNNEWSTGIIHGAVFADFMKDDFEQNISELSKDKPVYVYCAAGGRSAKAAEILKKNGFKTIIDLKGGMGDWKKQGMPVEHN